jgi:hypothetical protein
MLALLTTSQILDPVQRKRPEGTRAVSPAGT